MESDMKRTQKENNRIARDLMCGCPKDEEWGEDDREPWTDHTELANAILEGKSSLEIEEMEEAKRWPESQEWIERELSVFKD